MLTTVAIFLQHNNDITQNSCFSIIGIKRKKKRLFIEKKHSNINVIISPLRVIGVVNERYGFTKQKNLFSGRIERVNHISFAKCSS